MNENATGGVATRAYHAARLRSRRLPGAAADLEQLPGGPDFGEFIEQVRGLMDRVRLTNPSPAQVESAIAMLRELNSALDETVVDELSTAILHRSDLPANGSITLPPFTVDHMGDNEVRGRVTFRTFHLGGNSAAHGGHISLAFDTFLGTVAQTVDFPVRTASLTVDYRSITPLNEELRFRSWVERREGRKIFVRGTLHAGERLCAEANGLFLTLKPGQQ